MKKNQINMLLKLVFVLALTNVFCNVKKAQKPTNEAMKLSSNYEKDDYGREWATIDSLEEQGLIESALKEVKDLHERVKVSGNPSQIIKTLIYREKYQSQLEEEGLSKAINRLEAETTAATFPTKPILQSMLAEMYQQYLNNNQWKLNGRTQTTADFKKEDLQTWAIEDFYRESARLHWAATQDENTKQLPIADYKVITQGGEGADALRPTLYDFLVHRALDYFMNEKSHLNEPAFKFYLDDEMAMATVEKFITHDFKTKDIESNKYKTLLLFQKILAFHTKDATPNALVDADLKRLKFVYDNAVFTDKITRYTEALKALAEQQKQHSTTSEIAAALARIYVEQASQYDPHDKAAKHKWDYKTAKEICEQAIKRFPDAYGTPYCQEIIREVLSKNLSLQIESVNPSEKPALALLSYRNVKNAYFKVVRVDKDDRDRVSSMREEEERIAFLNSKTPTKTWQHTLPDDGDYHAHSLETKVETLPYGDYALLVSDGSTFATNGFSVGYAYFTVSNLGYFSRKNDQNQTEFVVFDRNTGAPLAGVKAEFFVQNYNERHYKIEYKKRGEGTTDKDGFVAAANINKTEYFRVKFSKGGDILDSENGFSNHYYEVAKKETTTTHLFMDRAIYRPGQTLYFKGLVVRTDTEHIPHILPNMPVVVTFYDANHQKIKEQSFKTNEYGTFHGSFTAPTTGLLGTMSIEASLGNARKYFQVEEYKRPKFEVSFKPVEGSYRLNDLITVKGNAKAFAGSNIDGAKVTYRVVREVRFPYWPWWEWGWYRPRPSYGSEAMEIANGTTQTNAQGEFVVTFEAKPDLSVEKSKKPQFDYRVYVDVLDITGETQSNETQVSVGYIALNADVSVAEKVNKDSLKFFNIITKNLSEQFEPAKGTITIQRMKAPERAYVSRYWAKPDQFILQKEDFEKSFPNYAFKGEDEPQNWEKQDVVYKSDFDTQKDKKIVLNNVNWKTGHYFLTLRTQDKYGEAIEVQKQFLLYDLDDANYPANQLFAHIAEKTTYEPSETANYFVATGDKMLKVLYEVEHDGKIISRNWLDVNSLKKLTQKIEEKHRGGLHYYLSYAKHNRAATSAYSLFVPWSNKDLNIEYTSFREKLQPGQDETWQLKISGKKGDKLTAEMLAAMYDASLDQFAANSWDMSLYPSKSPQRGLTANHYNATQTNHTANQWQPTNPSNWQSRAYRYLNWFNFPFWEGGRHTLMMSARMQKAGAPMPQAEAAMDDSSMATPPASAPPPPANEYQESKNGDKNLDTETSTTKPSSKPLGDVKVRTNLNETVFFMPQVMTDKDGSVILKFKMNEALTRWKFLSMAHTKDLKYGFSQKEIVTQKELMVMPNPPRFLREGDQIEFAAKVSNLSGQDMSGTAQLQLFDAVTMQAVDGLLGNNKSEISFTAKAGQSAALKWNLNIPIGKVQAVVHRVVARAGNYADGEENALPVLTNRMLVTESLPLPVRGKQSKTFTFQSLAQSQSSKTLQHQKLTLEFTSNPAWYAVQALPYLMEYPYDCTEQVFSRYYANALAAYVANKHPKVKEVFKKWEGTDAMLSNLSKNQELKYALLEETPWVLDAQNEEAQRKNIALLFDLNRMAKEKEQAITKIAERQLENGGFAWFPGGRDSWYITQYIVEGFGHLEKMGVRNDTEKKVSNIVEKAVTYIDGQIVEHYEELERRIKKNLGKMEDDNLDYMAMHYLYTRTFFLAQKPDGKTEKVIDYYISQADKYWLKKDIYMQGMLALALQRKNKKETPQKIVASLKERALKNEELGMYWKYNTGYWWYQLPIETHALMIEVFEDVAKDPKAVDDLKVWLLKNKQTNDWKTTKATASAVYALLMNGSDWLAQDGIVEIKIGNTTIGGGNMNKQDNKTTYEAGTGYFKRAWEGKEVNSSMAEIKVNNPNTVVAWGALYWQYFEQLDNIKTFKETPLKIDKKLFIEENSPTGPKLRPIDAAGAKLRAGDKLKVRIELRVDRDMEYVHLKDARASGFEPINVLSQYKWQGGLGYYESTRDASTNFFFDYLPKGTYVFEYPLRVQQRGNFSNGITTIQCMYAPEFTSHSEGIRVQVE